MSRGVKRKEQPIERSIDLITLFSFCPEEVKKKYQRLLYDYMVNDLKMVYFSVYGHTIFNLSMKERNYAAVLEIVSQCVYAVDEGWEHACHRPICYIFE